jgi:spermidine synthase
MRTLTKSTANLILLTSTLIIAICGLIYELLAGTISSYLLGDSIYQFSLVIGLFMAAMGVGSYLSRFISDPLEYFFISIQIAIALIGGFSALILFFAFAYLNNYSVFLFLISVSIGLLIGLEIPIIMRILKSHQVLAVNISNVLTADYIGALVASILFPLILVPQLGLMRTSFLFGILNALVAWVALYIFKEKLPQKYRLNFVVISVVICLILGYSYTNQLNNLIDQRLYFGKILYSQQTPYQKIVITHHHQAISLFINGNLQFNSLDEYRYHESLVHPVMIAAKRHQKILLLGAGDGLAVREILKYPMVKNITLVDIDPTITQLFMGNSLLAKLNHHALSNNKVTIINMDAWKFLETTQAFYDVIIIDLPDPNDLQISKLYSRNFYQLIAEKLGSEGIMVTQATSPFYARKAFWCIKQTLDTVIPSIRQGSIFHTLPYHAYIPTFGEWGFIIASARKIIVNNKQLTVPVKFLHADTLPSLFLFSPDLAELKTNINTLQNHSLTYYYNEGWKRWYE